MFLSYLRTVLLYLVLIAVIRCMGKRQIGQMEPSEFVVTMLVANLASIPMEDEGIALHTGLIPIVTVLGLELVLSWLSLKSIRLRLLGWNLFYNTSVQRIYEQFKARLCIFCKH